MQTYVIKYFIFKIKGVKIKNNIIIFWIFVKKYVLLDARGCLRFLAIGYCTMTDAAGKN